MDLKEWLIETRVVFELGDTWKIITHGTWLIETRVVFELV